MPPHEYTLETRFFHRRAIYMYNAYIIIWYYTICRYLILYTFTRMLLYILYGRESFATRVAGPVCSIHETRFRFRPDRARDRVQHLTFHRKPVRAFRAHGDYALRITVVWLYRYTRCQYQYIITSSRVPWIRESGVDYPPDGVTSRIKNAEIKRKTT